MNNSLIKPISIDLPCGVDAKYDDNYLSIESEVDKINSFVDGAQTNWQFVSNECAVLLENRTKDIRLLSWWGYAQYQLNSLEGFRHFLEIMNQMLEHFGQDLFPKSNKGKWGALSWIETIMNAQLIKERQTTISINDAETVLILLRTLQSHSKAACAVNDNLFQELCRLLEIKASDKRQREESEKAKPLTAPLKSTESDNSDISSDADAIRVLNQLKKSAEHLSHYWREHKTDDTRALRLTRLISWLEIDGLPPVQNSKTMINPPSSERIELIDTLMAEGKNDDAILMIESMVLRSPFWFAGHYKAFQIYDATQKYQAASEVKNMLVSFINSNDGIMNLAFRDGTPFVPTEIKGWINEQTCGGTASESETPADALALIGEQCYDLVNKKNSKEAMEILQHAYKDAGSQKEKFQSRLLHAQVAIAAGKPQMALALIDELEKDIEKYRLEEWQPELVAEVYRFYLNSFNRTQLERDKYDAAFQQLCRVDMAAAIDIK